jgi:hypothetical protein
LTKNTTFVFFKKKKLPTTNRDAVSSTCAQKVLREQLLLLVEFVNVPLNKKNREEEEEEERRRKERKKEKEEGKGKKEKASKQ